MRKYLYSLEFHSRLNACLLYEFSLHWYIKVVSWIKLKRKNCYFFIVLVNFLDISFIDFFKNHSSVNLKCLLFCVFGYTPFNGYFILMKVRFFKCLNLRKFDGNGTIVKNELKSGRGIINHQYLIFLN